MAKKYNYINGPGGISFDKKPKFKRAKMSTEKERQFEMFFADKENVTMSSYKVDAKTNMPILYLKDQKETLWEKFKLKYSNGMKKTSFMARLADGRFKYREDLGGLCSICNEYGYQIFEDLIILIKSNILNQKIQVGL
ncbi:MAG: hypothetical protein QOK71_03965 [Nitrososphaeraceae archaeon]|jgi:hypothetical protein|nr:hypothetical protein [Nitrososphaeraceae archaeon]